MHASLRILFIITNLRMFNSLSTYTLEMQGYCGKLVVNCHTLHSVGHVENERLLVILRVSDFWLTLHLPD